MYLKESAIVTGLDKWLLRLFDPANLDSTCEALAEGHQFEDSQVAAAEAAHRQIADCDDRLAKYRAALDAGADPAVVAGWIAEVRRDRQRAAALLKDATPAHQGGDQGAGARAGGHRQRAPHN